MCAPGVPGIIRSARSLKNQRYPKRKTKLRVEGGMGVSQEIPGEGSIFTCKRKMWALMWCVQEMTTALNLKAYSWRSKVAGGGWIKKSSVRIIKASPTPSSFIPMSL